MNEEQLTKLKHYYEEETPDQTVVEASWQELSARLPARQYHPYHYVMRYAAVVVVLALFLSAGMLAIQAASPNTLLYPMKLASEHAVAQLTGRYDTLIKRRTDAVINAAQKRSDVEIKQATEEYQKALEAAKADKEKPNPREERLRKALDTSETKLRAVTPANKKAQKLIQQSIRAAEKTQQEVKGTQTEKPKAPHPVHEQNPSQEQKPETPGNPGKAETPHPNHQGGQSSEHRKNKP